MGLIFDRNGIYSQLHYDLATAHTSSHVALKTLLGLRDLEYTSHLTSQVVNYPICMTPFTLVRSNLQLS